MFEDDSIHTRFLRLPEVLKRIPVSKSTWWAGIRKGIYPRQIKLSERTSAWSERDIDELCKRLERNNDNEA